jgi:CMP-N-acetylneuraminic acid synthetase
VFLQYQRRIGSKPFAKEVTFREAVDINTSEDFTLAEIMLKSDIPNGG